MLLIIACNGLLKYGYNVEEYDPDDLIFPWGKNCFAFFAWFAIAITKIHFAIGKVRSDNSNPEVFLNNS